MSLITVNIIDSPMYGQSTRVGLIADVSSGEEFSEEECRIQNGMSIAPSVSSGLGIAGN